MSDNYNPTEEEVCEAYALSGDGLAAYLVRDAQARERTKGFADDIDSREHEDVLEATINTVVTAHPVEGQ